MSAYLAVVGKSLYGLQDLETNSLPCVPEPSRQGPRAQDEWGKASLASRIGTTLALHSCASAEAVVLQQAKDEEAEGRAEKPDGHSNPTDLRVESGPHVTHPTRESHDKVVDHWWDGCR